MKDYVVYGTLFAVLVGQALTMHSLNNAFHDIDESRQNISDIGKKLASINEKLSVIDAYSLSQMVQAYSFETHEGKRYLSEKFGGSKEDYKPYLYEFNGGKLKEIFFSNADGNYYSYSEERSYVSKLNLK